MRILGSAVLVATFAGSVVAQEVDKLQEPSVATWVAVVAGVAMALLIGVASLMTPHRSHRG